VVTEADVDAYGDDCPRQLSRQTQLDALILVGFADHFGVQAVRIEPDAILQNLHLADASEKLDGGGRIRVALTEQIQVSGGPQHMLGPRDQQHGTLEHKAIGRLRLAEAE
jgi:hypothetical protein